MKSFFYTIFFIVISLHSYSQEVSPSSQYEIDYKNYKLRAVAELGYLGVFSHKIQFGENTTYFDYKSDGGQNVLFPISRLSLELDFNERNTLVFLYQPLEINTEVVLNESIMIDDILFLEGTNLNLQYGFPFYRLSYLRHLDIRNEKWDFAWGASLQFRNATIRFESADGNLRQVNRDFGLVPILKFRTAYHQNKNMSIEFEADGMYAPISYLNGSDNEVVGAILDASIRQKLKITEAFDTFLNVRYLGGGAVGTSDDTDDVSDGYTKNWLHFYNVTMGFSYSF